jgi:hypothetical protein
MKNVVKRMRHGWWAAALLFVGAAAAVAADQPSVRVVHATGPWLIAGSLVHDNAAVAPGANLQLLGGLSADQARTAAIELVYGGPGGKPLPWMCRGDQPCAKGTTVPAGSSLDPKYAQLAKALSLAPAVIPEFDISRGVTQEDVADGIVRRDGSRFDVTGLMHDVDPGTYHLVVMRPDRTGIWQRIGDVPVAVAPGAASRTVIVTIPHAGDDGLYGMQLYSTDGAVALSDVAWIVAATPPGDAARRSVYAGALDATRDWPDDAATASLTTDFLRRVLVGLADPAWST